LRSNGRNISPTAAKGNPCSNSVARSSSVSAPPVGGDAQCFRYQASLPNSRFTDNGDNSAAALIKIGEPAAQ
jgi:hypothetical protein